MVGDRVIVSAFFRAVDSLYQPGERRTYGSFPRADRARTILIALSFGVRVHRIGKALGISSNRVRQIADGALRHLARRRLPTNPYVLAWQIDRPFYRQLRRQRCGIAER